MTVLYYCYLLHEMLEKHLLTFLKIKKFPKVAFLHSIGCKEMTHKPGTYMLDNDNGY